MDKTAIKNFAVWARKALIRSVVDKCGLIGIREDGIQNPLPQSTRDMQFFDAGTGAPSSIVGNQIPRRDALVMAIREKERDSDYKTAYNYIVEQVAYTWFNRLIAIRFMEINDYLPSRIRVLSSEQAGKLEPDLVTSPFDANFDYSAQERDQIIQLKDRGQKEDMDALFRMLFVKQCDALHEILPGLFQKIDSRDYTELLLNISFTDREGVVYHLVNDIPEDNFDVSKEGQVEIIGWMYQYYNIEPKDETFALLKKNVKITKERIPAATQLFTPDWIVRYMVENSLGRLWLERNAANSKGDDDEVSGDLNEALLSNWKYYLPEAEQEPEVEAELKEIRKTYKDLSPENIKVIDPCMGSGHILVYCFDVLMQIYESQGYTQRDAAQSILENNLYGLDIDERAAQLAYFAVMMKARQYDRRIFTRSIKPKVYAIEESNHFRRSQLQFFGAGMAPIEVNKAKLQINALLDTLTDAKEYGSILKVESCDWNLLCRFAECLEAGDQMSLDTVGVEETQTELLALIDIAEVMAQKYHVVVTNPPYMGASGMSPKLSQFVKDNYPDSKSDLFACCIEKGNQMVVQSGFNCMVTMQSWMFLPSFERMREILLQNTTITNLMHMENMVMGIAFGTAVTVFRGDTTKGYKGTYNHITMKDIEIDQPTEFPVQRNRFAQICTNNFSQISGSPIAYWLSPNEFDAFAKARLSTIIQPKVGLQTGNNDEFLRFWFEVYLDRINFEASSIAAAAQSKCKWFPYNKGGPYQKWYGNNDYIVNWENNGSRIRQCKNSNGKSASRPQNTEYYFKPQVSWSDITSGDLSFRYFGKGFAFDASANSIFASDETSKYLLGYLNTKLINNWSRIINPTIHFKGGDCQKLPFPKLYPNKAAVIDTVNNNVSLAKKDWDSFETSWDFKKHPLV